MSRGTATPMQSLIRWLTAWAGWATLYVFCVLMLLFLAAPIAIVIIVSFSDASFVYFPPPGFSIRWYAALLEYDGFIDSFLLSVRLALLVTVLAVTLGTAAAMGLTRYRFPSRDLLYTFLMSPLIFPSIITGIALLPFFSMLGLHSAFFTLVIGHSLITLPSIKPGLMAGGVFAFIISFDNYTISMWLKSAESTPLPLKLFFMVENVMNPSVAAAALATGKPFKEAQYETEAAFKKLAELKPNLHSIWTRTPLAVAAFINKMLSAATQHMLATQLMVSPVIKGLELPANILERMAYGEGKEETLFVSDWDFPINIRPEWTERWNKAFT